MWKRPERKEVVWEQLREIKSTPCLLYTSKGATAEFFKLNERKLEALIEATTHDMEAAETAVLRKANDDYRKAIFNAQVYANTGAGTYEKAVEDVYKRQDKKDG